MVQIRYPYEYLRLSGADMVAGVGEVGVPRQTVSNLLLKRELSPNHHMSKKKKVNTHPKVSRINSTHRGCKEHQI